MKNGFGHQNKATEELIIVFYSMRDREILRWRKDIMNKAKSL